MQKHITNIKALSRFIQLFDASFPSGNFVHSFGLEPHIVLKKVKDKESLENYLNNLIADQYQKMEFVVVKKVFKLLKENSLSNLIKEDEKYSSMLSFEYAKASKNLGENYLKLIDFEIYNNTVKEYFNKVKENKSFGNELFILSTYAFELGLDQNTFLLFWAKKSLINIASASLKISRIKPSQIQQILFEFDNKIENIIEVSSNCPNNFNPLFEEIIFCHKQLEPKLFTT